MATQNSHDNKRIARQFFEAFQAGDRTKLENELFDKNYKLHFPGMEKPLSVPESLDLMKSYNAAFPDLKFSIDCQIGEGDYVVTRIKGIGTHKGEFQGISATNKKVTVTGISIHCFKNGKITEEWTEYDAMGLLHQVGAIPEMANQH